VKLLITGGCGFIGSAVVRAALRDREDERGHAVVNVDKLTYAADPNGLNDLKGRPDYVFEHADICDLDEMARIFREHRPDAVLHLAAESHVDRSIDGPSDFIATNVVGTYTLLEVARSYVDTLDAEAKARFRFHHVSTDEVYGALGAEGTFTEESPYRPNSPYAATKASSDMLVRAWGRTYGLPVVVSNCSNNYGPRQFPEKLIPVVLLAALEGRPIPVYGRGENVRDWLYVDDHADALLTILRHGRVGETYNVGGGVELANIDLVRRLCAQLDETLPESASRPHADLITFVEDRPGHDFRYAIDAGKLESELGWRATTGIDDGLRQTVAWYLDNDDWWRELRDKGHGETRLGRHKAPA